MFSCLDEEFFLIYFRQLFATIGAIIIFPMTHEDVVYSYLPLYHSSGGQLATAGAFFTGTKTIIKKKFSASSFWKDIVKYDVTVNIQHIVQPIPAKRKFAIIYTIFYFLGYTIHR